MQPKGNCSIEQQLQGVAPGEFCIQNRYDPRGEEGGEALHAQTQGRGKLETFHLYEGITWTISSYLGERVCFHHPPSPEVLELRHCHQGRIGWNMRDGIAVYLGPGDLCVHTKDRCADSQMNLPLGYYEGIGISIDLQKLEGHEPEIVREAGIGAALLRQKFCQQKNPLTLPASAPIDRIFGGLYGLPEALRVPCYKLKVQEALLYLGQLEPDGQRDVNQYVSQQTELIRQIHDFLVHNLDRRFTIEELAKRYLINTSSLKSVFKAVYGVPLATYVKEYRIRQAMELLRGTDESIAQIAKQVGYETQGKFTKAFKESVQLLPTEYRRQYKGR